MTIHLLRIPSEPADWSNWLEEYFRSDTLGELVHELELVRRSSEPFPNDSLSDILSPERLESIRQSGLRVLSASQIQQLLASPKCLLDLQETLLLLGSDYWDAQLRASDLRSSADRISQATASELFSTIVLANSRDLKIQQTLHSRQTFIAIAVALAATVLGVMFWPATQHPGSGRILGQAGLVTNDVDSSAAYFKRLADAGATWFDNPPATNHELGVLLAEVSNDCQFLIDAPHEALSKSEREWFVTKCQNWKTKLDETLASLNANKISFTDARSDADATMTKLVDVLRAGPTA